AGLYRVADGDAAGARLELLPEYCFAHGLVRLGLLVEEPHSSATFRTRTLWSILGSHGITVGVIGWPLTQPAPVVRGFLASDGYHRTAQMPSGLDNPRTVYPPELLPEAGAALEAVITDEGGRDPESPARVDRIYERVWRALAAARPVQVAFVRYQSL